MPVTNTTGSKQKSDRQRTTRIRYFKKIDRFTPDASREQHLYVTVTTCYFCRVSFGADNRKKEK